jgi:hypothetical protein
VEVTVGTPLGVAVRVGVLLDVEVIAGVPLGVAVRVSVFLGVDVLVEVLVRVGNGVSINVDVGVRVGLGVDVLLSVGVSLGVDVGVWVAVGIGEFVGVGVLAGNRTVYATWPVACAGTAERSTQRTCNPALLTKGAPSLSYPMTSTPAGTGFVITTDSAGMSPMFS